VEPPRRLPHLIRPNEVAEWLAGSRVQTVTYHRTDAASARSILERGVNIDRAVRGTFGQGFYTATSPEAFFGPAELVVAVRLDDPLIGHLDDIEAFIDQITDQLSPLSRAMTPTLARRMRR
jgi:hypothetical protein